MRFTRLVIEADTNTVSLALHPRLTVIAGVDDQVRTVLCDELIGALDSTRSGVHLELVDGGDRHLAVFRPSNRAHRAIDVSTGADRSDEFRAADGRIDLLAHHGLDLRRARDLLLFDGDAADSDIEGDQAITRLADVDQQKLWAAAARVQITDEELAALHADLRESDEDQDLISNIENRHQVLDQAVQHLRSLRRQAAIVAAVSIVMAALVWRRSPSLAAPILGVGVVTVLLTLLYRARVEAAQRAERSALSKAGEDSYLGYVMRRVNGLFDGTEQRRRLSAVAEDHRAAAVRWTQIAGDVSVEWAVAHHDQIEATAKLRRQLGTLGRVSPNGLPADERSIQLAHGLVSRLALLRRAGRQHEDLPLIIDDPFVGLPDLTRTDLLDLLLRTSGPPQVILLTNDTAVTEWARFESLSGDVGLVEPAAEANADELAV